jgi:U6 snRNA-associated Sm-like protein LSm1
VHLRDGRKLIGVLRSYDQYGKARRGQLGTTTKGAEGQTLMVLFPSVTANLVLTQTVERLFHPPSKSYAQTDRGVFLIRGENVVLLGEIVSARFLFPVCAQRCSAFAKLGLNPLNCGMQDLDLEDAPLLALTLLPWNSVASLLATEKKTKDRVEKVVEKVLFERRGFGEEGGEGDAY